MRVVSGAGGVQRGVRDVPQSLGSQLAPRVPACFPMEDDDDVEEAGAAPTQLVDLQRALGDDVEAVEPAAPPADADLFASLLPMLLSVRERVAKHVPELSCSVPIAECTTPNYMGFCNAEAGPWVELDATRKTAALLRVNWISVRVRDEDDPLRPLALTSVVATLLHELAHTLTPHALVRGVVPEHGHKRSRKWRFEDHGPQFYANFSRILVAAEAERVFVLRGSANKFSVRSLRRFDAIDCGSAVFDDMADTPALTGSAACAPRAQLRVLVQHASKGRTQEKPVTVALQGGEHDDAGALLEAARRALNAKGKCKLVRADGSALGVLADVADGARLLLVKAK